MSGKSIGDTYWYVVKKSNGWKLYCIKICSAHDYNKGYKQFNTEEEAKLFINGNNL